MISAVISGAVAVGWGYMMYRQLPKPYVKRCMIKAFKAAEIYQKVVKSSGDKKHERLVYPSIKRIGVYEDRTQVIFSVPDGINPADIYKKDFVFKQVFGELIELTGNSKTFNLMIYSTELAAFDYDAVEVAEVVKGYDLPILAGRSRKGFEVYDMCEHPHLLIAGETGSGKSVQLRSIISTIIQHAGDRVDLYCADLKRSEFYLFRGIAKTVDVEPIKLLNTLLQVKKELKRRGNILDKAELSNINDLPADKRPNYIVVAIDEVALLKKEKDVMEIIEEISAIGRALGVFLILSMQRPDADVLDGKLKNNLTVRMAFRHADGINSRITLGSEEAATISQSQKGRFYMALDGLKQVQAPLLSVPDAKELLAAHKRIEIDVNDFEQHLASLEPVEEDSDDFDTFGGLDYDE